MAMASESRHGRATRSMRSSVARAGLVAPSLLSLRFQGWVRADPRISRASEGAGSEIAKYVLEKLYQQERLSAFSTDIETRPPLPMRRSASARKSATQPAK